MWKRLGQLKMPFIVTTVGRKWPWMKLWQRPNESNGKVQENV